jgi:hypothetical protein
MNAGVRAVAVATLTVAAASFVVQADVTPQSESGEIQIQLGNEFMAEGRYNDALDAFRR